MTTQDKPPWRKVLHADQPYADNYTDESFLEHLVLNADVKPRSYWGVVYGTSPIIQQLSIVAASVAVPIHLHQGSIGVWALLLLNLAMLLTGYALFGMAGGTLFTASLWRGVRQYVLLIVGVYLQAPLLMSLARTISSDTIVAVSAAMLVMHLYLFDYAFMNSATQSLQGSLSLGAAVGSSVLVASRLEHRDHVFAHVLFSLELFLLSPHPRRFIRTAHAAAHLLTTCAMTSAAAGLLAALSKPAAVAFLATVLFMSFLCPLWLICIQKYKQKINGPWDEAVPKWSERVSDFQRAYSTAAAPTAGA